jgi:hypothetical protein
MQPERPECQCLACAQLQHHEANDTLLLFAIGTVLVILREQSNGVMLFSRFTRSDA